MHWKEVSEKEFLTALGSSTPSADTLFTRILPIHRHTPAKPDQTRTLVVLEPQPHGSYVVRLYTLTLVSLLGVSRKPTSMKAPPTREPVPEEEFEDLVGRLVEQVELGRFEELNYDHGRFHVRWPDIPAPLWTDELGHLYARSPIVGRIHTSAHAWKLAPSTAKTEEAISALICGDTLQPQSKAFLQALLVHLTHAEIN